MNAGGLVIVGVGGTGVLKAGEIVSNFLFRKGYDVRQSEVHGMAQRGGSVITQLRYGEKVYSPLLGRGDAQYMVATEEIEALRYADYLSPSAIVILNAWRLNPVGMKPELYTGRSASVLGKAGFQVYEIDASSIACSLKNSQVMNTALVGALSKLFFDCDEQLWEETIKEIFPTKLFEINMKAFIEGRNAIKGK